MVSVLWLFATVIGSCLVFGAIGLMSLKEAHRTAKLQ